MSIELLRFIPLSGDFCERTYDAIGTCTWVLFSPPADEQWVGVFGNGGVVHHSDAALSTAGGYAFVVAGGQGYAVEFPSGDLLFKTECGWLTGVLALPGTPYVLACDFTDLHAFNATGKVWTSGRIALDGIRLLSANDREVKMAAWHFDGWYEVAVQVEPFSVRRGSLLSVNWDAYSDS